MIESALREIAVRVARGASRGLPHVGGGLDLTAATDDRGRCSLRAVLQHVTLEVAPETVRDCVAFWALLGFTEMVPPPMLRDEVVWVEREGAQIHYAPTDDPSPPAPAATWRSSRPTTRPSCGRSPKPDSS